MKIHDIPVLFFLLILLGIGCKEDSTIHIEKYICPDLSGAESVLYEYENTNVEVFPLKYLLIHKVEADRQKYAYIFLDTSYNFLSEFIETRKSDHTQINEMTTIELDQNNEYIKNKILIDTFSIPYEMEIGNDIKAEWKWQSKIDENTIHHQKTTRKLIGKNDHFSFQDSTISVIDFYSTEFTISSHSVNPYEMTLQFNSTMTYALGLGLIEIRMNFNNGAEAKMKLVKIHSGKNIEVLLENLE